MDFQTFLNVTLFTNFISSLINVFAYGIGYYKLTQSKVDGKITRVKKNILFQFFIVITVTILFALVFAIVIFDPQHTTSALYILNFTLLLFNIGFNLNIVYLAYIVDSYEKQNDV